MTTQNKRKDDELLIWAMVGGIFTLGLLGFDFFYSSINEMSTIAQVWIWIGHGGITLGWIVTILGWANPNYDVVRKAVVAMCVILMLVIGIHHATVIEDKQVIIDSKENAVKP